MMTRIGILLKFFTIENVRASRLAINLKQKLPLDEKKNDETTTETEGNKTLFDKIAINKEMSH